MSREQPRRYQVSSIAHKGSFLILFFTFFTLACDPGIVIHQQIAQPPFGTKTPVTVRVKSKNLLVGVTQYSPVLEIENRSDIPITIAIAGSELVARAVTFQSESFGPDSSNIEISPGESKTIELYFDLKENVGKVFREPAELRIHYRSRGGEQIVSVTIVGRLPGKTDR